MINNNTSAVALTFLKLLLEIFIKNDDKNKYNFRDNLVTDITN